MILARRLPLRETGFAVRKNTVQPSRSNGGRNDLNISSHQSRANRRLILALRARSRCSSAEHRNKKSRRRRIWNTSSPNINNRRHTPDRPDTVRAVRVHPYYEDSEAQTGSAIHELNQNLGAHIENANAPKPWSTPARYAPVLPRAPGWGQRPRQASRDGWTLVSCKQSTLSRQSSYRVKGRSCPSSPYMGFICRIGRKHFSGT